MGHHRAVSSRNTQGVCGDSFTPLTLSLTPLQPVPNTLYIHGLLLLLLLPFRPVLYRF